MQQWILTMIDKVLLKYFKNLILLLATIPQFCYMLNKRRIYSAKYKAKVVKKPRVDLCHIEKKSEGKTYKCGGF